MLEVHEVRSRWLRHLGGIGSTGSRPKGGAYSIDRARAGENRVSQRVAVDERGERAAVASDARVVTQEIGRPLECGSLVELQREVALQKERSHLVGARWNHDLGAVVDRLLNGDCVVGHSVAGGSEVADIARSERSVARVAATRPRRSSNRFQLLAVPPRSRPVVRSNRPALLRRPRQAKSPPWTRRTPSGPTPLRAAIWATFS